MLVGVHSRFNAAGNARPPDAERADAHPHPGFGRFDGFVHVLHEVVNVAPALGGGFPVSKAGGRPGAAGSGIGVEIVVQVHPVNVVAAHDVHDNLQRVVAGGGGAGVHQQHGAVSLHQIRACEGNMVAAYGMLDVGLCPEWVEPGVQFNAAAVSLLNGESQRIIPRIDARAGKPLAPRFQRRAVQGVGIRAHLEKHGVQLQLGAGIQDVQQLRALGCSGEAGTGGPVNIMNGGYPCRAEFLGDSGNGFSGDLPPKRLGSQGQQGAGEGMEQGKSGHDGEWRRMFPEHLTPIRRICP